MSRLLLCAAIAALLTTSPAFAADHAELTIYHADNDALFSGTSQGALDAGNALVHETRTLDVSAGSHEARIGGLPAAVEPEAIAVGFGNAANIDVVGERVVLANADASGALDSAVGQTVDVLTSATSNDGHGGDFRGILVGASRNGVLIRTSDGTFHLVHHYESVTLPAGSLSGGSTLLLDLDAKSAGQRDARLTYMTSGLGWRAAYKATLDAGEGCRMQFDPQASIANRSGRDYEGATIKLVAGQPNFGNRGIRMYSRAAGPAPMTAQELSVVMPSQASLGDYRSFTLSGAVSLPDGTVTLTSLYPSRELSCQREYLVEDGGRGFPPRPNTNDYGAQDYRDRAITSNLTFEAPEALPAGMLRAWTQDHAGAPALLGEGNVADTPKGQKVSVQLGQSFDLRASRERTSFHVDAKARTMREAYRITLTNGGDSARTVTVREHPDRWREWKLDSSNHKPAKQTPQLLEFEISIAAHGESVLEYAVRYAWSAKDM